MKLNFKNIAFGLMLTGGFSGQAMAVNTAAGTDINNRATLTFDTSETSDIVVESSVLGNSDTGIGGGSDTTFEVDRKLDIEVARVETALVPVAPGDWAAFSVTVTNNGNDVQDVLLTFAELNTNDADPDAGTDTNNTEANTLKFCVTAPDASGACTALTNELQNLAIDGSQTIFVVAQMQDADDVVNADKILVSVLAQAAYASNGSNEDGGTAGAAVVSDDGTADDVGLVQNVLADGAGPGTDGAGAGDDIYDGYHSDVWGFVIVEANVTVTKTAVAVWDPYTCDDDADDDNTDGVAPTTYAVTCTGNPKAIPGGYVEYTITITNATGAAEATGLSIEDEIQNLAEQAFVETAFSDETLCVLGDCGIYVLGPFDTGSPPATGSALTNAADLDDGEFTSNTVTVSNASLEGGETLVVKFRVEIQ